MKIYIDGVEVLCDSDITIEQEFKNTSSVILNNVYPKSWEVDHDYVSNFYFPPSYAICTIYNEEEPILPSGYQEVDYIQSSGTQYIDTGMKLNQNSEVELKVSNITYGSTKLFGSRSSATSNNYSILTIASGMVLDFQNYNNNRLQVSTPISEPITISMSNQKLQINTNSQNIGTYTSFTTPGNAYIFNGAGSFPAGYTNASMRLYYCRLYDNGTLVRNFIPCYRKSDNVVGLYDIVNNQFYTNAGTGTFTYGNEIQPTRDLLFSGVVKNTGEIELNPRYPHFCNIEVVDFTTFLSEGKTLDFVIAGRTITQAINDVVSAISGYNFQVGTIDLDSANDVIGAYSTLDKTAYDVFQYISDITGCRWFTRIVDETTVEINFIDADKLTPGTPIQYTTQFFEDYLINDMTFSYGTYDYRNRQVITSDNVSANITQTETINVAPYQTDFTLGQNISSITSITLNGVSQDFATNSEKDLGITADFYYTIGSNQLTSSSNLSSGQTLVITYTPLIRGREVVLNNNEIQRIANSTQTIGSISRYEKRNDSSSSDELQAIGQSYIKYKGVPEINLTIECRALNWTVGQTVYFNAPLPELSTTYLVKSLTINYVRLTGEIFYTYELNSAFNDENAINYFDNQRYKNAGNIEEGKYIDRDIDIENMANLIFYDTQIVEA